MLGIVGESGSGKSVTMLALMGLVPFPGRVRASRLAFAGRDLRTISDRDRRALVGKDVAMIFQDPTTSLNPCFTVGFQLGETLRLHLGLDRKAALRRATELLEQVGIPAASSRLRDFPHQLSGGMNQRVMIAMAIACNPRLLIADEPTTALDVTIQAQILDLLRGLQRERGMALILVTHNMGVVAEMARRVAVMYAGQIVEERPADALFAGPEHPYTAALLAAMPERSTGEATPRHDPGEWCPVSTIGHAAACSRRAAGMRRSTRARCGPSCGRGLADRSAATIRWVTPSATLRSRATASRQQPRLPRHERRRAAPRTPTRAGRSQGPKGVSASVGGGRPQAATRQVQRCGGRMELLPLGGQRSGDSLKRGGTPMSAAGQPQGANGSSSRDDAAVVPGARARHPTAVVSAQDLSRIYEIRRGPLREPVKLHAVGGVSFAIEAGDTLAVVGESGCGKSTLARIVSLIEKPSGGQLSLAGTDAVRATPHAAAEPAQGGADGVPEPLRVVESAQEDRRDPRSAARDQYRPRAAGARASARARCSRRSACGPSITSAIRTCSRAASASESPSRGR